MNKIIYSRPAKKWTEALPVGNGEMGVMIFGGRMAEKLCFNDGTLWSGAPSHLECKNGPEYLNKARECLFSGDYETAHKIAENELGGFYSEGFLPLADAYIVFSKCSFDYKRELDLRTAVHTVHSVIKRESFVSYPKNIFCYRASSDEKFSAKLSFKCQLKSSVHLGEYFTVSGNAPDFVMPNYVKSEKNPICYKENFGMAFALCVKVKSDGKVQYDNNKILIENARNIEFYFASQTGFSEFNQSAVTDTEKVEKVCSEKLNFNCSYEEILTEHIKDFSALFSKSNISFCNSENIRTDYILKQYRKDKLTPEAYEIFYNFGKYLFISCSREGGRCANLQGIWNKDLRPPWSSNYTVNINTQMNYWGADRLGIDSCVKPYLDLVYAVMQNGKKTAESFYGCRGFACNHNVDIWAKTSPTKGNPQYAYAPLCGIWLANEIYAIYKNGLFQDERERVYEIVREGTKFICDYVVMHNGEYVICPSTSPENHFKKNGKTYCIDISTAFDIGVASRCLKNFSEINTDDDELSKKTNDVMCRLSKIKEGKNGICEFYEDYTQVEPGHRHFSPLYAFYPANQIGYYSNNELLSAVEKTFRSRISNWSQYIGWSAAWGICIAAKLHDSETVSTITKRFLTHAVFKNLFCYHPPKYFQIDGNLGFIAAVHGMLLYEEDGITELLPAVPSEISDGKAENLLVNSSLVSFEWQNGLVTKVSSSKEITIRNKNLSENIVLSDNITVI